MQTVLISGGSEGLGKTLAMRLAQAYHVVIVAPNEEKLRQVAETCGCEYKVGDVRDYARMEQIVQEVGEIDHLINNAGIWLQGDFDATDPARMKDVIEVNTLGTLNLARAVAPGMKARKTGRIINVISSAGLHAKVGWPVYTASKWAITGFTKSLQQEFEPFGIAVTGLYPATMDTQLFAKAGNPRDLSHALRVEDVAKSVEFILSLPAGTNVTELGMKELSVA